MNRNQFPLVQWYLVSKTYIVTCKMRKPILRNKISDQVTVQFQI